MSDVDDDDPILSEPKSFLTPDEVERLQTSGLKTDAYFAIRGASHGMFSVARHYGGMTFNGYDYTYDPNTDELIRDDVLKLVMKWRREAAKTAKAAAVEKRVKAARKRGVQKSLFGEGD